MVRARERYIVKIFLGFIILYGGYYYIVVKENRAFIGLKEREL